MKVFLHFEYIRTYIIFACEYVFILNMQFFPQNIYSFFFQKKTHIF
jgi:hypothetical protein